MTKHFTSHSKSASVVSLAAQSGAVVLDLSTASVFLVNLTGNVTSLTFTNPGSDGAEVEIQFIQDGTGSRTLAGVDTAINLAGALTLTTTLNKRDILTFRTIGGQLYEKSRSLAVTA